MRGHIRKRGKTYAVVVDVGRDEAGKRKQRWHSGFKTKKEAEAKLTELLGRLDNGTYVEPTKLTLGAFLDDWLRSVRASSRRPSTIAGLELFVREHIKPGLGRVPLQRLTTGQIDAFNTALRENGRRDGRGLSPRSVAYAHTTLRMALGAAVRQGLLLRNPADLATPPKQSRNRELKAWSKDELKRFLESVAADRDFAALHTLAFTGLRRGELLALRWRDVDLDAGKLTVARSLVSTGYRLSFSEPKTAAGRRRVDLDQRTVAVLKKHRQERLVERSTLGLPWPGPDDLVFARPDGEPPHPVAFSGRFRRLVRKAGVPAFSIHSLRHTHATLLLLAGVHPRVVQERLGHANVAITLQTYSHVLPTLQTEAADRFAALVGS